MAALDKKNKTIVICGPTATGKSGLALQVAKARKGEIISADSMQIYKHLVVGTAALTPEQAQGVPVHLTGFLEPDVAYSVADWCIAAAQKINEICDRGHTPILCGGTGLYIQSLLEGVRYQAQQGDDALRDQLYRQWEQEGAQSLYQQLEAEDPQRAAQLHCNDKKRILRALELRRASGLTAQERNLDSKEKIQPYISCMIGLNYTHREHLYAAIHQRVDGMMEQGIVQEAEYVWRNRETFITAAQAIGYKEFFPYFEKTDSLEACCDKLKQATRNYAKRQLTWFRAMSEIHWFDVESERLAIDVEQLLSRF